MKSKSVRSNEQGVAHLLLIAVIVLVIAGVGYLVYWRFQTADQSSSSDTTISETAGEEELNKELEASLSEAESSLETTEQEEEIEDVQ